MFIAMFLLTFLALALLVKDFRNKYILYFSLMIVGLNVSSFASMTVLAKIGMYGGAVDPTSFLDYELFLRTSNKLTLPISALTLIMNIGRSVYLGTIPLMVFEFSKFHGGANRSWTNRIGYALFFIFPVFLVWLYDDRTALSLLGWMREVRGGAFNEGKLSFLSFVDLGAKGMVLFYLTYPVVLLILDFRRTSIRVIKTQMLSFAASLFFMNVFFFLSSYIFFVKPDVRDVLISGMWYISSARKSPPAYLVVAPVIVFSCSEMILVNVLSQTIVSYFHGLRVRFMRHYFGRYNNVLRDVLHSFKNTIFSLSILSEKIEKEYGTEEAKAALSELRITIANSLENTGKLIGVLREIRLRPKLEDLAQVVRETGAEFLSSSGVDLSIELPQEPVYGYIDLFHIRETLRELLRNATEQVVRSEKPGGRITVALERVGQWIHISVQDNGPGIPPRQMPGLFKSFVTTRDQSTNWGIGLSYVKKVVKGHLGLIWAESEPGERTTFQILLPATPVHHP